VHQIWAAATIPSFLGWLVDVGLVPPVHGRNAQLSGADLSGADLSGADLSGARSLPASLLPAGWRVAACNCCVERIPPEAAKPEPAPISGAS